MCYFCTTLVSEEGIFQDLVLHLRSRKITSKPISKSFYLLPSLQIRNLGELAPKTVRLSDGIGGIIIL